ncbi:hypothetical protein PVAP13_5KG762950 [Panicum virgatum]|uniref:Uncharacterized protein n=1 Tax=Panicum virgatum TaxID=38727 RepID=A0A8T0T113_PANVG|nr:hypothetical protein PVAP13_5KG762950 [Panicum virgatum]
MDAALCCRLLGYSTQHRVHRILAHRRYGADGKHSKFRPLRIRSPPPRRFQKEASIQAKPPAAAAGLRIQRKQAQPTHPNPVRITTFLVPRPPPSSTKTFPFSPVAAFASEKQAEGS